MITLLNSGKTITFNCYYLEFIARVWAEEQAQAIWTGPRLVTLDSWQIANDFITRFKFLEERSPAWESMICMAKRERERVQHQHYFYLRYREDRITTLSFFNPIFVVE